MPFGQVGSVTDSAVLMKHFGGLAWENGHNDGQWAVPYVSSYYKYRSFKHKVNPPLRSDSSIYISLFDFTGIGNEF
jgi:hypothetical protein